MTENPFEHSQEETIARSGLRFKALLITTKSNTQTLFQQTSLVHNHSLDLLKLPLNFTRQQVESITQQVLHELRNSGVAVHAQPPRAAQSQTAAASTGMVQKASSIEVHGLIITEDTLIAAKAEGRTIRISSGAVITPSARDYISQHEINLSNSRFAKPAALKGVAIVSASSTTLQAALRSAQWPVVTSTTDFHAATEVATNENTIMLCSVQQPSVAACLLNRNQRFRAAVVNPTDHLSALQTAMAANVICLNPKGWSIAGLMSLLQELSVGRNQPALWKEIRS